MRFTAIVVTVIGLGLPGVSVFGDAVTVGAAASGPDPERPPPVANLLRSSGFDLHETIIDEGPDLAARSAANHEILAGYLTSRVIRPAFPFNEALPSWNVHVPDEAGFHVELRFGLAGNERWTSWYGFGGFGDMPSPPDKNIRDEDGRVNVDYFVSRKLFDRLQYRLRLSEGSGRTAPRLHRFAVVCSHTLGDEALYRERHRLSHPLPAPLWQRRLPVPFRSQATDDPALRGRICSPTALGMVMEYRGVNRPTEQLCEMVWDAEYRTFGNWSRAIQAAFDQGVPGYLTRVGQWDEVKQFIAREQPLIVSLRFPPGGLTGAPYRSSTGHLLVIVGFDEHGDILVNDPGAKTPDAGRIAYRADEMQWAWLDNGGVAYVLLPPE